MQFEKVKIFVIYFIVTMTVIHYILMQSSINYNSYNTQKFDPYLTHKK